MLYCITLLLYLLCTAVAHYLLCCILYYVIILTIIALFYGYFCLIVLYYTVLHYLFIHHSSTALLCCTVECVCHWCCSTTERAEFKLFITLYTWVLLSWQVELNWLSLEQIVNFKPADQLSTWPQISIIVCYLWGVVQINMYVYFLKDLKVFTGNSSFIYMCVCIYFCTLNKSLMKRINRPSSRPEASERHPQWETPLSRLDTVSLPFSQSH